MEPIIVGLSIALMCIGAPMVTLSIRGLRRIAEIQKIQKLILRNNRKIDGIIQNIEQDRKVKLRRKLWNEKD